MRLAKNLESIANTQDDPSPSGECSDRVHDGRKAGYGARAQVVPVGKAPRQDEGIHALDGQVLVPDQMR